MIPGYIRREGNTTEKGVNTLAISILANIFTELGSGGEGIAGGLHDSFICLQEVLKDFICIRDELEIVAIGDDDFVDLAVTWGSYGPSDFLVHGASSFCVNDVINDVLLISIF
ncbi:MAG TPA: hypothetical protein EYO73_05690 [Sulfurimonas sp.]|nr:hypothetical protein [Sulfurimonas sp.]